MEDHLRRIAELVDEYKVDDFLVAMFADSVIGAAETERHTVIESLLIDMVLLAAGAHRVECQEDPRTARCTTCALLMSAVQRTAGVIRAEADLQLRAMLGD
jgi:hypothetical protein